jgi:molecular chaperone DnaK
LAEARNAADNLIYVTEKSLNELGDRIPVNDRSQIEQTIEELKGALNESNLNRIRQLTEQLQQASHALTQQMYQQQAGPNGSGPAGEGQQGGPQTGTAEGDEDVVEGEYRQV